MTYKFGAGGSPVSVTSGSTYQMQATDTFIRINKTSGSATAITLAQTPVNYQPVTIKDDKGDAGTNNITITPYSGTIDGATNVILQGDNASVTLEYNGTEWNVIASTAAANLNGAIPSYLFPVTPPLFGLYQTLDYVPARDGLALLTGGPNDAGYATNFAANPKRLWMPRDQVFITSVGTNDPKGGNNYHTYFPDPEYAWSNSYTPFALDSDGNLRIRAQTTSTAGFSGGEIPTYSVTSATFPIVSGALSSRVAFSQQFGYWEVTAKLPVGYALWPAIWMLPVTEIHPPEIDILEIEGGTSNGTNKYQSTVHSIVYPQDAVVTDIGQSPQGDFHKYAVNWTDAVIEFYYDDIMVHSVDMTNRPEFQQPFFLYLSNQVGSTLGGWVPAPDGTTPSPADMIIKSVRVWQYKGPTGLNLSNTWYLDSLTTGQTVATISAPNYGGNTSMTFTELSDPDNMFTVSGSNLNLSQAVAATTDNSHPLTLKVTDSLGLNKTRQFTIGVQTASPIQANYFTSQNLTNAFWTKTNVTAPLSNKILETTANAGHFINNTSTVARTAGVKTFNYFAEFTGGLGRQLVSLWIFDNTYGNFCQAYYDITRRLIFYSAAIGAFTNCVPYIAPVPSSSKIRCGFQFTTDGSTTGFNVQIKLNGGDIWATTRYMPESYVGDTTKGIFIDNPWLYNINAGSGGS